MNPAEQQVKRIREKMQQLLKQYATLQKENNRLKDEASKNREQGAQQQKNIEELKQQSAVLKLNAGELNDADKKEMEKKINSYLKEIDRCIALLGE